MQSTRVIAFILTASAFSTFVGCASTPERSSSSPASPAASASALDLASKSPISADRVTLHVNGLSCPLCASNVDRQIGELPGVASVDVNFEKGTINLALTDPRPSPMTLERAVDRAGFTLVTIEPR